MYVALHLSHKERPEKECDNSSAVLTTHILRAAWIHKYVHLLVILLPCRFGFNNGQTMVDGLYAGSTFQVRSLILPCTSSHVWQAESALLESCGICLDGGAPHHCKCELCHGLLIRCAGKAASCFCSLQVADFKTIVFRQQVLGFNAVRLPFTFSDLNLTPKIWTKACTDDTAFLKVQQTALIMSLPAKLLPFTSCSIVHAFAKAETSSFCGSPLKSSSACQHRKGVSARLECRDMVDAEAHGSIA